MDAAAEAGPLASRLRRRHAPLLTTRSATQSAARGLRVTQMIARQPIWRSIIMVLIPEMALAGFRPFGQTLAQFMMVWQR